MHGIVSLDCVGEIENAARSTGLGMMLFFKKLFVRMQVRSVVLVAMVAMLSLAAKPALAECPPCGPDYCKSDPRFAPLLAKKKQRLTADGYPERLLKLLDKDGECVARVERSPDVFTLQIVAPNGDWETLPWTEGDEALAKKKVADGSLKAYYIFNARHAFSCCNEPKYSDRPDYIKGLDLNSEMAISTK